MRKKKKKKVPLSSIHTYGIKEKECSDAIKDTIKKKEFFWNTGKNFLVDLHGNIVCFLKNN